MIDLETTKKNIIADGRTPTSWARIRGFTGMVVINILRGYYPTTSPLAQRIIEELRKDGYLVEVADGDNATT